MTERTWTLYICKKTKLYFSKKKEKEKKNQGALKTTLHTVWPRTFFVVDWPSHFVIFCEPGGDEARKIIGIQRTLWGFVEKPSTISERTKI